MEFSSGGKWRRNTVRLSLCALHFGPENIVWGLACAEISQRLIKKRKKKSSINKQPFDYFLLPTLPTRGLAWIKGPRLPLIPFRRPISMGLVMRTGPQNTGQSDGGVFRSACEKEQQLESASAAGRSVEFAEQPITGVAPKRMKGARKKEVKIVSISRFLRSNVL